MFVLRLIPGSVYSSINIAQSALKFKVILIRIIEVFINKLAKIYYSIIQADIQEV